jgi:hypothetical protein
MRESEERSGFDGYLDKPIEDRKLSPITVAAGSGAADNMSGTKKRPR